MDAIYSRQSVYLDGRWMDARWMVETLDGETGEMVITATVIGEGAPVVAALRMDMGLAARLREAAGFEGARPGVEERLDELERKHDAFYATVQTAFALAQRADAEAEMREVAGEAARNAVGGCSYQLTEHWQRIEELTSGMIALEERLHTLSGVVRLTQGRLALVADDDTAIGRVPVQARWVRVAGGAAGGVQDLEAVMTQSIVNIQTSDLMTALSEAAGELANFPAASWGGWIAYFLEELQVADDGTSVATGDYDDMLNEMNEIIVQRLARGGW